LAKTSWGLLASAWGLIVLGLVLLLLGIGGIVTFTIPIPGGGSVSGPLTLGAFLIVVGAVMLLDLVIKLSKSD